jgi:hypothetical protein
LVSALITDLPSVAWLAAAIPVAALWIAYRQMRVANQQMGTARLKSDHDRFGEKRLAVFQATKAFLGDVISRGNATNEALHEFLVGTTDAEWVLSRRMCAYLKEIHDTAAKLHAMEAVIPSLSSGNEKNAAVAIRSKHFDALRKLHANVIARFQPWLRPETRRWWKRY